MVRDAYFPFRIGAEAAWVMTTCVMIGLALAGLLLMTLLFPVGAGKCTGYLYAYAAHACALPYRVTRTVALSIVRRCEDLLCRQDQSYSARLAFVVLTIVGSMSVIACALSGAVSLVVYMITGESWAAGGAILLAASCAYVLARLANWILVRIVY